MKVNNLLKLVAYISLSLLLLTIMAIVDASSISKTDAVCLLPIVSILWFLFAKHILEKLER